MDDRAISIAAAILSLKQDSDWFKDYIFPITMSFFSAFMGGVSAYYFTKRHEISTEEVANCKVANKLILKVLEASTLLNSFKSSYIHIEESHPIIRAMRISPLKYDIKPIDFDLSLLSFIKDVPTANRSRMKRVRDFINFKILGHEIERPSPEKVQNTWRNIKRISNFLINYKCVVELIESRFNMDVQLRGIVEPHYNHFKKSGDDTNILNAVPNDLFARYLYETEQLLSLIDHLIVEFYSFAHEFPSIAESNIELSCLGRSVGLTRAAVDSEFDVKIKQPYGKPNYTQLSKYTNVKEEKIFADLNFPIP
ncbi:hypothetical protein [Lelliottia nimipressuralis]|uniref:hypothetical protein n=1 Tax=Lelliottia nimipressuralis TaxID=69220 RepID=UPI003D26E37D